jgi:hypothetical protein
MSSESASTRRVLLPHPLCDRGAITDFSMTARRAAPQRLEIVVTLHAELAALELPQPCSPARMDGLWRHTCFELFLRRAGEEEYREYNFSPSGAWAAYQFTSYRSAMTASADAPVEARWHSAADLLELSVALECPNGALRLGCSAVIESKASGLSYWALIHPSEKPDFHHADAFDVEL